MTTKQIKVIISSLLWTAFCITPLGFYEFSGEQFAYQNLFLLSLIIINVLLVGFYYFNYYVAIPRYFSQKKYTRYGLLVIICFLFVRASILFLDLLPYEHSTIIGDSLTITGRTFLRFTFVLILSICVQLYNRLKSIEEEKLKTELSYLKAQINPHFLFNTLNGIYTLILKKSDYAGEAVVKLSLIMRYVITDTEKDMVPLDKEIKYISDYIDLQKFRTSNTKVIFNVMGDIMGSEIAPLILLPYIENAFKHGVSTEENSFIEININVNDDVLNLKVVNKKVRMENPQLEKLGKGNHNVLKRLEITYPTHKLTIQNNNLQYIVNLQIPLK